MTWHWTGADCPGFPYFTPCIIFFSSGEQARATAAQPRPIHISSQNRCS